MTELSGTLDGVGLPAIVRFLGGLKKTGHLRLSQQDWHGELYFDEGQLRHASLGSRTGLAALDALAEVLPSANFAFDSQAPTSVERTITLGQDEVLAHLDQLTERLASGGYRLPSADAVPVQTDADNSAEDQVSLDRATLQTLLAVDGRHSVREIVARRGSFDALWQLARLSDVGLVRMQSTSAPVDPVEVEAPAPVEPVVVSAPPPALSPVPDVRPVPQRAVEEPVATGHCPKLGFEDDPRSSFGRPTRLHRCFAAGAPLPLSLDQQRELCLTEQFGTCPRLVGANPTRSATEAGDAPRIVRLPLFTRPTSPEREAPSGVSSNEPRPLRPLTPADSDTPRQSTLGTPTPLRSRLDRGPGGSATAPATLVSHLNSEVESEPGSGVEPTAAARLETPTIPPPPPHVAARRAAMPADEPSRFRLLRAINLPVLGVVLVAGALIVWLLMQENPVDQLGVDMSDLPNTTLVASGTPVADLELPTPVPTAAAPAEQPTSVSQTQPTAVPAAPAGAAPRSQPTAAASAAVAGVQATPAPARPTAQPTPSARAPLFDEQFASNNANWPDDPRGVAMITNGAYRLSTRQAGQFVAVSAPVANVPSDVVVSAIFKKLAGPAGGGYGIIVRDQQQTMRDGTGQGGQFYVLEAGDKGEIGIWRRETDHWVDLLPWQHSDAVNTGTGTNELSVKVVGNTLTLSVNGNDVSTRTDDALKGGQVGLFVGGDGNQVAVSRFTLQTP
jgi:hypothetical protein